MLPAGHALHGFQIGLVHHTQRFLAGDDLMSFIRERAGVQIIRKHTAAREMLRSLKRGEIIGIPLDQNAKRSRGDLGAVLRRAGGNAKRLRSPRDDGGRAGRPGLHRAPARRHQPRDRNLRRDPATAHRRPRRRRAGKYARDTSPRSKRWCANIPSNGSGRIAATAPAPAAPRRCTTGKSAAPNASGRAAVSSSRSVRPLIAQPSARSGLRRNASKGIPSLPADDSRAGLNAS